MGSKRILMAKAKAGMVIASDVYTSDSSLIITKGSVLTDELIEALKSCSIFAIRIETDVNKATTDSEFFVPEVAFMPETVVVPEEITKSEPEEEVPKDAPPPDSKDAYVQEEYYNNVKDTKDFKEFQSTFIESVDNLKDAFNNVIVNNSEIDEGLLLTDVKSVVAKGRNSMHIFDMLQCMQGYDDTTYMHCMNVALLSNMIGRIVYPDMSHDELDVLTLSGLLCDIGKMMIPEEIILKKDTLSSSEQSVIKTHVFHGNNILKNLNLDPRISEVAMRHHERCDGSGYPGGYRKDQIDEFARIVAIADTYDAMTSDRAYRKAICPFDVMHMFEREGRIKFDVRFLLPFLDRAAQSFVNAKVLLSNDEIGRVILINKEELSKPIVKVKDNFYNLSLDTSISIKKVLI